MVKQYFGKKNNTFRIIYLFSIMVFCLFSYSFNSRNNLTNNEIGKNSKDSLHIVNRTFFAKKYLLSIEDKLLKGNDKIMDTILMDNNCIIEKCNNDSLKYFVFSNNQIGIRKILFATNNKLGVNCSFLGELNNSFILGYGTSTNNQDWILFNKKNGKFIVAGGRYLGSCTDKNNGVLFFLHKSKIYFYSEEKDHVTSIINLSLQKKNYDYLHWHWHFVCDEGKFNILYQGKFKDTIIYPASQ